MASKRRGLGKSLDELIGGGASVVTALEPKEITPKKSNELLTIAVEKITPSPYQPRREFSEDALQELAESIRTQGVIQPIVVRSRAGGHYELIAGERRWRAAQLAGLGEIPAVMRDVSDETATALALIENIQRENLNPIEQAYALQRLIDDFGLTHQQTAEAVGKSRVTVSNLLRLLNLHVEVKTLLSQGQLEMGHARALLALPDGLQANTANEIIMKGLSVRETERLIRIRQQIKKQSRVGSLKKDPDILQLEQKLSDKFGTKVAIAHTEKGKGQLTIYYHSLDALDGILEKIT